MTLLVNQAAQHLRAAIREATAGLVEREQLADSHPLLYALVEQVALQTMAATRTTATRWSACWPTIGPETPGGALDGCLLRR